MEHAQNTIIILVITVLFFGNMSCSDSKVRELKDQLRKKDTEYTRLKNDFLSTQELNDKQYEELIAIQKDLSMLDSLSFIFRTDIEGRKRTSYTMEEEINNLIGKIKEDIKQKNEIISNQSKAESKLRVFIKLLTEQLDVKEKEINRLKRMVNMQNGQISNLGNQLEQLESREKELNNQIVELETTKRLLEKDLRQTEAKAYYDIAVALENAASSIPVLKGIFINSTKKDEVLNTKAYLNRQAQSYYKKASDLGYKTY